MNSNQHIDFLNSYSANTAVVPEVIEHLIDDLKQSNYKQDEIDEIVLSLDEALTNADPGNHEDQREHPPQDQPG